MDNTRWEVRQNTFCGGWVNTWSITEDGVSKPHTFATREEAQAELNAFLKDIADEIESGERDYDQGYDIDDFYIARVGDE